MRVIKVLNTSVVLALDDSDTEVVLMGKGIGFHKSIGASLEDSEVEKVFVLKDRAVAKSIIRLSAEIDGDIFEVVKETVDYARQAHGMRLMDHIYLALTDHLAFAVQRTREGMLLPELYSHEVRRLNPAEFDVARHALALVERATGTALPEGELANIAFHFINAQTDHPQNRNNLQIETLVRSALDIVKYTFNIVYNRETVAYSRFLTHLQAFAQRLVLEQQLPEEQECFLYDEVARGYPSELACAGKISRYVEQKCGKPLTNQEMLYLTIHIHRILQEHGRGPEEEE